MKHTDFPSMPPYEPNTPERDGAPYVRVTSDSVILDYGGDKIVELPFRSILKNGLIIQPGNDSMVNLFTITLMTSGISVDEGSESNADNDLIKVRRDTIVAEENARV